MNESTETGSKHEEVLRDVRAELATTVDEIEAFELVCSQLAERFTRYAWVGVYVVEGEDLVLSAWSGPEETEHTRIGIGEGICGLAAETGETEVVPDVGERPEFIACFPSTRSEIVVPIRSGGEVLGEIDVDSDDLDAFEDADRELLEAIADELSAIMEPQA